ncbi:MAG: Na+/H+ antiporter NhaC family protein [Gammaproteobacteria bacterium]
MALAGVPLDITIEGLAADARVELEADTLTYTALADAGGRAVFEDVLVDDAGERELRFFDVTAGRPGERVAEGTLRFIPGWLSILPPLLAIFLALALRSVIPALMIGIWCGATTLVSLTPSGAFRGLLESFQLHVTDALADRDHAMIILFSLMIGGMVGIVIRNGGMHGVVRIIMRRADDPVSGQLSVWLMGIAIFFDDYGNSLVVGNTARSVTDRLRISREKLAYIVDSTAAPITCIALATTWIGYEVGLIGDALKTIPEFSQNAYSVFLSTIPYSFYPLLALFFVFLVAVTGRDFGPMHAAEVRARSGRVRSEAAEATSEEGLESLEPDEGAPIRAVNGVVPILVLIVTLLAGLLLTGQGESLPEVIGSADPYKSLMWGSLLGVVAAALLSLVQRILTVDETIDAWYTGVKSMLFAMVILVLAWALAGIAEELRTADYLVSLLGDSVSPPLIPALVFVLSALTAFSTGTSWGTMGILMPLVIPLTWAVMSAAGMTGPEHHAILYSAIACNLAGAVWGDHCSPISDTTILSSMASGCDHIEHVRTQLPYAMVVGLVAVLAGTLPAGYGLPWWIALPLGGAVLFVLLRLIGRRPGGTPAARPATGAEGHADGVRPQDG